MSKKIKVNELLGVRIQNPDKLSVLAFDSLYGWLTDCADNHEFDMSFQLDEDCINMMVYFLRCTGKLKSEAIRFVSKAFESFPHLVDSFIDHGFISPFISIIKDLFMFDEYHCDWYPIIMTTRYAVMMSSEFRDKIVDEGVIECIIPNCKNYMFSVSLFVGTLFPPFCAKQSVGIFEHFLPLFEHFLKLDAIQHANLVLSCLATTPMDSYHHSDLIIRHGIISYLETLRDSNVRRISRGAQKFVNSVNVASLLDGVWWIYDEE